MCRRIYRAIFTTTKFLLHSVESEEWRKIGGEVAYLLLFLIGRESTSFHLLLH